MQTCGLDPCSPDPDRAGAIRGPPEGHDGAREQLELVGGLKSEAFGFEGGWPVFFAFYTGPPMRTRAG